jgi:hypothetical protein
MTSCGRHILPVAAPPVKRSHYTTPAKGFDAKACGDGFLSISPEIAFSLMREADRNTDQLIQLQDWTAKQAAVDPNIEPAQEAPPNH